MVRVATAVQILCKGDFSLTPVDRHARPYRQGTSHMRRHVRNGVRQSLRGFESRFSKLSAKPVAAKGIFQHSDNQVDASPMLLSGARMLSLQMMGAGMAVITSTLADNCAVLRWRRSPDVTSSTER